MIKRVNSPEMTDSCTQTNVTTNEYLPPTVLAHFTPEENKLIKFMDKKFRVLTLGVISLVFVWLSYSNTVPLFSDGVYSAKLKFAISLLVGFQLLIGIIFLPDPFFRNPHPVFWKTITTFSMIYAGFLVFMLTLNTKEARETLQFFDDNLNTPLPERNYADNCSLSTQTFPFFTLHPILECLIDPFVVFHFVGWLIKMVIIRDVTACWILSVVFELCELIFAPWLVNFAECWWDSLILDVFGMNALGIYLGKLICDYLKEKNGNTTTEIIATRENKTKIFKVLSPTFWTEYKWNFFSDAKSFLYFLWASLFFKTVDLVYFFIKVELWIPVSHPILGVRVVLLALLAAMSVREFYEFKTNENITNWDMNMWIFHVIMVAEWAIVLKHGGIFTESLGVLGWGLISFILISCVTTFALLYFKGKKI